MYNVLEKLRAGEPLSDKDRKIHDEGLVSILKQIHEDLNAAVFKAYGWEDLTDPRSPERDPQPASEGARVLENAAPEQELLTRLVALNHERATEEANGHIRWLRPEYQSGGDLRSPLQTHLPGTEVSAQSPISNHQFLGPPAPPPSSRRSANSSPPPARTPTPSPPASGRRPRQESTRSKRSWRR